MPVKNEPCFGRKTILLGRCPSGDRGRGRVGSEIERSATFLRGAAHPKSPLTETVTLVEIEDIHSMMELNKAVTHTAPDAESRLEPTPTREQTALGRRSATDIRVSIFRIGRWGILKAPTTFEGLQVVSQWSFEA